ncbi:MAG: hypothetical protein ACTSVB_00405 [Candidatus Heimdallarchaeaceae archaeon]
MSEETVNFQNPLLASKYIRKFTHYSEFDNILINNLDWKGNETIGIYILPIIDTVPSKKNGIFRIFVSNKAETALKVKVHVRNFGYLNEKEKLNKSQIAFRKLIIDKNEVWYRDVIIPSDIKLGKNFFQLVVKYRLNKKKRRIYDLIDYTEIMPLDNIKQIARKNFLGLTQKSYINPSSVSYWIYCSLFGPRNYSKEPTFIYLTKWIVFLLSISTISISFIISSLPEIVLYVSSAGALLSFLTFFTDLDRHTVHEINELGLTELKRKALVDNIPTKIDWFKLFTLKSEYFYFIEEELNFAWKTNSDNSFKPVIYSLNQALNSQISIKEGTKEEEERIMEEIITNKKIEQKETKTKVKEEKKEHEGITFEEDLSISFDSKIQILDSITSYSVPSSAIELEDSFELPVEVIKTETFIEPDSIAFDVIDKPFTTELEPIITDSESIDSKGSMKFKKTNIEV